MNQRELDGTDLKVSQLCFGCWGVASDFHWGNREENESVQAMLAAVDSGVNFFDTAPVYGNGESESLLGRVFKENRLRNEVVIASKAKPDGMRADEIITGCEDSLRRLRTDYIDLYQTHWTNRDVPLAETWGAMMRLREQGKVRYIGVSNMGLSDMSEISGLEKPLTNQLPYNLLWRMIEEEILPTCRSNGVGILAYSPLMHGMLADKYQSATDVPDGRARSRHFSGERPLARHGEPGCETETFAAIDGIRSVAADVGRKMADVALAWVAQQPGVTSVIAGARNEEQLRENVKNLENPLHDEVLGKLADATDELKGVLGPNPDMWDGGENSRYR